MAITKKQMELDIIKWKKSEAEGKDACGSFDYCVLCDKSLENPCDKAYTKFNKKTEKKNATNKMTSEKSVKTPEIKPVVKKTVSTKKTTKK